MTRIDEFRRKATALVMAASIACASSPSILLAQSPAAATSGASVDGGWPRAYVTPAKAQMLIYEPQVASWDARARLVAYAAVAYQPADSTSPSLGTIKIEARTSTSLENRLVRFSPLKVTETNFGKLSREQIQDVLAAIDQGIPDSERVIALDRVLAGIDRSQIYPRNVEGVKAARSRRFSSASTGSRSGALSRTTTSSSR